MELLDASNEHTIEKVEIPENNLIEAKEKINIQVENQTLASITYQNYFRLYGNNSC